MSSFSLIRRNWSNEYMMAGLFVVLLMYLLPRWTESPSLILSFIAVLSASLAIDVFLNFIRYRRPTCAVSAAVTAAVLDILTPGVPITGKLIGITFALAVGKHLWGGTGKNIFNPAALGLILISLIFNIDLKIFSPTPLLLPAVILSIPFIRFRPFSALGLYIGIILALIYRQDSSMASIISYGTFFWGFILASDPATVTPHPYIGLALGLFFGFIPLRFAASPFFMALGILLLNIISYAVDNFSAIQYKNASHLKLSNAVQYNNAEIPVHDLTEQSNAVIEETSKIHRDEILKRIKFNGVFGLGGAAYPTYKKIKAVMDSKAEDKHLIINGIECDPGLVHDKWIMRQYSKEIYTGIELLSKCVDFKSVTLAVKDSQDLNFPEDLKTHKVGDYYPAGAERYLIREVLNKKLSIEVVPADEGILVLNVQTVYSVYEAVTKNMKAETRFLTLVNIKEGTRMVIKAPLGSKVMDIVNKIYPQYNLAFCGGGLMKCHTASENETIGKTVNFIGISDFPRYKESPHCSKCGSCTNYCPEGLMVNKIAELVTTNKMDRINKYHAERCLNCGICSYICPAGRNLSSRVQTAREYVKSH